MQTYKTKVYQHLGIIAGICDEIGLVENIDSRIPAPKRKVSIGRAVKSMIINALGFSNRAMYLHPKFYRNKPVDLLIGENISADDLHDDCLGTALDALYDYGVTELFYHLASYAFTVYKIPHKFVHLDTTTFSLYGRYNSEEDDDDTSEVVKITKGYSKDNHPDLNQVVVSLMCSYRSSLPLWIETLSGNSSDKKSFVKSIKMFKDQFKKKKLPCFVADSAMYTAEGLKQLEEIKWVTRVPENVKLAKECIANIDKKEMTASEEKGYSYKEVDVEYAEIRQRWLVVFSQQAYDREYATLAKHIRKENENEGKALWHLSHQFYACEADAIKAAERFSRKLKYHQLEYRIEVKNHYDGKGRPDADEKPVRQEWYITGSLIIDAEAVGAAAGMKGFFIIATNELDRLTLDNEQLLSVYKAQGVSVERGFRFLKDPEFFAESLYLKLPKRIMALIMIMGLSLLIYSLAERKLRKELAASQSVVPDQKGKPTVKPTIRWVFQLFEDILILYIQDGDKLKLLLQNNEDYHETIARCLGVNVRKMYFFDN